MRRVRTDLTAHLGGRPNAVQRALIERAVILSGCILETAAAMHRGLGISRSPRLTATLVRGGAASLIATAHPPRSHASARPGWLGLRRQVCRAPVHASIVAEFSER